MAKKKHVSSSLERHVRAPRVRTWEVLLREIESKTGGYVLESEPAAHSVGAVLHRDHGDGRPPLVETVLSHEPPWRRSCQIDGDTGLDLCQGTFVIRDDGDECHVAWAVVVDPEPTVEGRAFLDATISAMGDFLDRVVAAAEA